MRATLRKRSIFLFPKVRYEMSRPCEKSSSFELLHESYQIKAICPRRAGAHTFIFPNFREAHKVRKVILRSTLSFQSYQLTGPVMCADFWRRECCSTTSSREPLRGADRKPR